MRWGWRTCRPAFSACSWRVSASCAAVMDMTCRCRAFLSATTLSSSCGRFGQCEKCFGRRRGDSEQVIGLRDVGPLGALGSAVTLSWRCRLSIWIF